MTKSLKASHKDDAIGIILDDHARVQTLFEQFEKTEKLSEKKKIAAEAILELKIHATIEEEIFYPAVRGKIEDDLMNEADEEHHVAKFLIAELEQMDGSEGHWSSKFTVLSECVEHHIKEEESEMLPKVSKLDIDLKAIGDELTARKEDLKKNGIPVCAEEALIANNGIADSPARMVPKKAKK